MKFKGLFSSILGASILGLALMGGVAFGKSSSKKAALPVIAVMQIVEHPALDSTRDGIIDQLKEAGYVPGETCRLLQESAQGDPVLAAQIARRFVSLKPALIVAVETPTAQVAKGVTAGTNIPVIFGTVTDPVGAQLVREDLSGSENVVGTSNWMDLVPQLDVFLEIVPTIRRIGFIYNPSEINSTNMLQTLRKEGLKRGIEVVGRTGNNSAEVPQAASSLASKVDAIFISNDNTALSAFESVVKAGNEAGIPVFVSDVDLVKRGAVAAYGPDQYALGRQAGRMAARVLGGVKPSELKVQYPEKQELYINLDAAGKIGLTISPAMKERADWIY